ncbi:MAG: hypothetical protein HZB14_05285 [Actinobacteria bacterium]|nr:hypothetical protein [Actinomycetota bacterium]
MQILLATLVLAAAVAFVVWPLLRGVDESALDAELAELEIAKQAKYREIRDAEIDHKAGKLTDDEWRTTDAELRTEATRILAQMDRGENAQQPTR